MQSDALQSQHKYIKRSSAAARDQQYNTPFKMKSLFSTATVLLVSLVNISQGVPTLFARQSSDDIGSWIDSETTYSDKALLANINPEGAVKGFVAASPSTSNPVCIISYADITMSIFILDNRITFIAGPVMLHW